MGDWAGGCGCGALRYDLAAAPMFVNCCHCSWCQRESGSAFAVNALIETALIVAKGAREEITNPTASGKGQRIVRCAQCKGAVWSHYAGAGPAIAMVKAGTLDAPGRCQPQAHIYTSTKLPWVVLAGDVPVFEGYYEMKTLWSPEALDRRARAQGAG